MRTCVGVWMCGCVDVWMCGCVSGLDVLYVDDWMIQHLINCVNVSLAKALIGKQVDTVNRAVQQCNTWSPLVSLLVLHLHRHRNHVGWNDASPVFLTGFLVLSIGFLQPCAVGVPPSVLPNALSGNSLNSSTLCDTCNEWDRLRHHKLNNNDCCEHIWTSRADCLLLKKRSWKCQNMLEHDRTMCDNTSTRGAHDGWARGKRVN